MHPTPLTPKKTWRGVGQGRHSKVIKYKKKKKSYTKVQDSVLHFLPLKILPNTLTIHTFLSTTLYITLLYE